MKNPKLSLTLGWLYPDLMSTYGDRGNILILTKRCQWRNIRLKTRKIGIESKKEEIEKCDILFMGGAQDRQQEVVNKDLIQNKGDALIAAVQNQVPSLFICGAYQFMGKYYKLANGNVVKGLSLFDIYTENPGENEKRLIGDIVIKSRLPNIEDEFLLIGFENHGGRTYLSESSIALGKVLAGYGNNEKDKTEGILYRNAIGTYLHGPILSKNPEIADYLIKKAIERKYKKEAELEMLDNQIEKLAKDVIVKRHKIEL